MFQGFKPAATAIVIAAIMAPASAGAQNWGGSNNRPPRGSYQQSCNDISVRSGRLYASCRDVGRNRRASSLELSRCGSADVANDNGLLVCGAIRGRWEGNGGGGGNDWGGNNGGGWGGSRGSITIYRDANFRGESATFQGEIYNLSTTRFNDVISSMRMRGRWEACTDSNFRGQCRTFDGDVQNLDRWGLNDKISSLRPVRRGN